MKNLKLIIITMCVLVSVGCQNKYDTSDNEWQPETDNTTTVQSTKDEIIQQTQTSSTVTTSTDETSSLESLPEKQPDKFVYDENLSIEETIEIIKKIVAEFPEAWTFEQVHEIFGEPDEAGGSGMYREKYLFGDLRVDFINPTPYMITVRYPDANGEYKIEVIKYPE